MDSCALHRRRGRDRAGLARPQLAADRDGARGSREWELEARLMDIAIDEGVTSKCDDGSNQVAVKRLLPEVKKAQQDLVAKPIPDDGAPTRFTP